MIAIIFHERLDRSIWSIVGTLTGSMTPEQDGPGSNDNEEVLHIFQISSTEASLSDAV